MSQWKCPKGHTPDTDTPFFYAPSAWNDVLGRDDEIGVLAYPNIEPSYRWQDGTAGVPEDLYYYLGFECDDLPHCVECYEEVVR